MSPSHNLRAAPNYRRPSTIALPPPLSTNDLIDAHRPPKRCKSPSGNLRATTTDTCLSLPPLPSLGSSLPNHHPLYPIATSPLDPSIALSLVLLPSASSSPRPLNPSPPSTPFAPSLPHPPCPSPPAPSPVDAPVGRKSNQGPLTHTPLNRQRNKPLRPDICVSVSII